jgi:hypothetical protein
VFKEASNQPCFMGKHENYVNKSKNYIKVPGFGMRKFIAGEFM